MDYYFETDLFQLPCAMIAKHVLVRELADGRVTFLWNPSKTLRPRGFKARSLGTDFEAAQKAAEALNKVAAASGVRTRNVRPRG